MLLRRIALTNFRGIRSVAIDLDQTTVIIGENSAGKTTLLDAVAICCSGRDDQVRLEVRDFHQAGDGPPAETLSITLRFLETDGEWRDPTLLRLAPFVIHDVEGHRFLELNVVGERNPLDNRVTARWYFGAGNGKADQTGLLAAWRRLHPLLRLRANRYVEADPRGDAASSGPTAPAATAADPVARQLERQIRLVYDRLTGAVDIEDDELRLGLAAAEQYLADNSPYRGRAPEVTPLLMSELAENPLARRRPGESRHPLSIKQGTGTRGLALVALVGALLEGRDRYAIPEEARPLLVLEDVEAHLHPTTLAAMWDLVDALQAQKIVTTNSGEFLASVPLRCIRRLVTDGAGTRVYSIGLERYSVDDLRRIAYHVRINRAGALFARCWLLVEGETEAWLLPELAQLCGADFRAEGIRCVEFAQSGLRAILRLANDLGIEWHLLTDGDEAGRHYAAAARGYLGGRAADDRITVLDDPDIEHCLYYHGYADLYRAAAGASVPAPRGRRAREKASAIITRAIHARSKPGLALAVLEAANRPGSPGVPWQLRSLIATTVRLARPLATPVARTEGEAG